jgi:hypothetical protein
MYFADIESSDDEPDQPYDEIADVLEIEGML